MAQVVSDLEFRDVAARQDFQILLRGSVREDGPSFQCPDNLSLREFARKQFEARPELHKPEAAKPETAKASAGETAAPGKQFQIEQIRPGMTDKERAEGWAAIQRALGIEAGNKRYRNE